MSEPPAKKYDFSKAEARKVVSAVINAVKFCGRQGIALRGHRDLGALYEPSNFETSENEGNFRALLRYAGLSDPELADLFTKMPQNATYLSKEIQNEIIALCGSMITEQIVEQVKNAHFFAIIADETTDSSGIEQFSLSLRFVSDENGGQIKEMFVGFQEAESVSGEALAAQILNFILALGLDVTKLRGQGYDGASNMSGKFRGVQARLQELYPTALYTHCFAHCLSLCCAKTSQLPLLRNLFCVITRVHNFFVSAKRQAVLAKAINDKCPESRKAKLTQLSPTRWVEKHEAIATFSDLYPAVVEALKSQMIGPEGDGDAKVAADADDLLRSIRNFDFLVSMQCCKETFQHCHPLSISLQDPKSDMFEAMHSIKGVLQVYREARGDADSAFSSVYEECLRLADEYNVEVVHTRFIGGRKRTSGDNLEAHYRERLFIPMLDSLIEEFHTRFSPQFEKAMGILPLIPAYLDRHVVDSMPDVDKAVEFYMKDLKDVVSIDPHLAIKDELVLWRKSWSEIPEKEKPRTAIETYSKCDQSTPCIRTLLKIAATLPVTTATAERSFSTLSRMKTYARNTMGEERLTGLALMNIHRTILIPTEKVLDRFKDAKPRRLEL